MGGGGRVCCSPLATLPRGRDCPGTPSGHVTLSGPTSHARYPAWLVVTLPRGRDCPGTSSGHVTLSGPTSHASLAATGTVYPPREG